MPNPAVRGVWFGWWSEIKSASPRANGEQLDSLELTEERRAVQSRATILATGVYLGTSID